jgi:3-hydroxyacyl-[acyl-carrier-protein] dehydratase
MKLLDDFYLIERESGGETEFEYTLLLNGDHFIYRAHFPDNPVTPGVCLIQICRELMEHRLGKPLFLKRIMNVKFLSVVDPLVTQRIQVMFSKLAQVGDGYSVSAQVYREGTTFAKLGVYLQSYRP